MSLQEDNKRIAKNTLMLYGRMIFMMCIGLYTSRVILNALGVSDLGLMHVAGSVVAMFTFLNHTLSSGTQRFLSISLGERNIVKMKDTFSSAITFHLLLAITILILTETIGLWYIYNKLNIEPGRFDAALWCYQLSIISTIIGIIQVPFNAALVAHERMNMYAYMSIYDASFKLLAAYLIQITPYDRVIFYSTLCFVGSFIATFIYNWYCRRNFEECSFRFGYNKTIFKEMFTFSSWNTIGCLAAMGQGTGVNLVINSFCGTFVNGAKSIASQTDGWVTRFVSSFLAATRPQIMKTYAAGNISRMGSLVCNSARFGCYLLLFLGVPLFIEIKLVLSVWLGQCPDHTVAFMRITMIQALFKTIGNPTIYAMHATGRMKELNISVGTVLLLIVPISYLLFRLGASVETVLLINVIPWTVVPFIRVYLLNKYVGSEFPSRRFIKQSYFQTLGLAILMFIPPFLVHHLFININDYIRFILVGFTSVLSSTTIIYYLGFNKTLREKIIYKLLSKIKQIKVTVL